MFRARAEKQDDYPVQFFYSFPNGVNTAPNGVGEIT